MPHRARMIFPVGGVGTVTISTANLPAGAGAEALVVPVEAVFKRSSNSPRNEPHVWVVAGEGDALHLEDRRVSVGQVTTEGVVITHGLKADERVVAAGVGGHANKPVRIWTRERDKCGYLSPVYS